MSPTEVIRLIVGGLLGVVGLAVGWAATALGWLTIIAFGFGEPIPSLLWPIVATCLAICAAWLWTVVWTAWRFWFRRASSTHDVLTGVVHLGFCLVLFGLSVPLAVSGLLSS